MKTIKINYMDYEGEGKTIREAKIDATRKIQSALKRLEQKPVMIKMRDYSALVYPSLYGWEVRKWKDGENFNASGVNLSCTDKEGTIQDCKKHLAQLTWTIEDGLNHPDLTINENKDLSSWFEFQIRYKMATNKGMTDQDSFDYAGKNPARPEIWKENI
jgi:hypothetical protein